MAASGRGEPSFHRQRRAAGKSEMLRRRVHTVLCLAGPLVIALAGAGRARAAEQTRGLPERITPLTRLIKKCSPSAVDMAVVRARKPGRALMSYSAGSILHETGYIVSNNHTVHDLPERQATLDNGKSYFYQIIARMPAYDLALIKIDAERPLEPVKIGRSNDLILGEPVLVFGNPSGLSHTATTGVVSGLGRGWQIQTNASINLGNSGGPMLNMRGELIGIVATKRPDRQNIAFAIAVDQMRTAIRDRMQPERRVSIRLGMTVDPYGTPKVTDVVKNSPAAKAGVLAGDIVRRAGTLRVGDSVHYYLALAELKAGVPFPLEVARGGNVMTLSVKPAAIPLREPAKIAGLVNGLRCDLYLGRWQKLPDFDKLAPAKRGKTGKFSFAAAGGHRSFALRFAGYVKVPADGIYTFFTTSDDGCRLLIGGRVVINDDSVHGAREWSGYLPLKAGMHPITVQYFQLGGAKALRVAYQCPGVNKQEIPAKALYIKPDPKPEPKEKGK